MSKNNTWRSLPRWAALTAVFGFILFPLVWIVMMSLKGFSDIIAYPPRFAFEPTLINYRDVIFGSDAALATGAGQFVQYLMNSVIVSGGAVLLSLLVGVPAAYALSRNRIRGAEHLAFTFLSFRFAPELVIIIPLFAIFQNLGIYDTYFGMILAHQLITIPLVVWIVRTFLADVAVEIEEAAEVDGAGPWRSLLFVVVPIIRPGLASAGIIAFIFSWNNLLLGLVLSGPETQPVTVGILQAIGFDQVQWGWMAAAAMVAAIPGMIVAVYFQRHLVQGLTLGAGK